MSESGSSSAAGYLKITVNAALHVGYAQPVKVLRLQDVVIRNRMTLEEGFIGVETGFIIRLVEDDNTRKMAKFSCRYSNVNASSPNLKKHVLSGHVPQETGLASVDTLPERKILNLPISPVSIDRFYL